ncbi:MAG: hypothetical protein ACRBN8_44215 [Nannocystales bacterium]
MKRRHTVFALSAVFALALGGRSCCSCERRDPGDTDGVAPGDSCRGIDPNDGLMTCDDALENVLFCSSVTKYRWVVLLECDADETCWHNDDESVYTCMPDD